MTRIGPVAVMLAVAITAGAATGRTIKITSSSVALVRNGGFLMFGTCSS